MSTLRREAAGQKADLGRKVLCDKCRKGVKLKKKSWTSFSNGTLMTNELHAHLAVTANSLLVPAAAPAASPSLSRSRGGATEAHLPLSLNRLSPGVSQVSLFFNGQLILALITPYK